MPTMPNEAQHTTDLWASLVKESGLANRLAFLHQGAGSPAEDATDSQQALRGFLPYGVTIQAAHTIATLRAQYWALAHTLFLMLPASRERQEALARLEDSVLRMEQCLRIHEGTAAQVGVAHQEGEKHD